MGNIHINHSLDPDQQIFQYLSFHDLVDLLKFNQAFFARADRPQRQGLRNTPGKWHYLVEKASPAPKKKSKTPTPQNPRHNLNADAITLQSWALANTDLPMLWNDTGKQQPRVCIVSSIRALSESLFTNDATSIFIEQASDSGVAHAAPRPESAWGQQALALPGIEPDSLCAIAITKRADAHANLGPAGTYLRVDLSTLLSEVIVPHYASQRYMELITKLVQESVWVTVTRANPPVAVSNVSRLAGSLSTDVPAASRAGKPAPVVTLPRRVTSLRPS